MKRISSNHIVILLLLLSSCSSTNFMSIDVMKPAAISFAPDVVNIVVVDNAAAQPDDQGHITIGFDGKIEEKTASSDTAKIVFKESLVQFMNEDNYFNEVKLYPHNTRTDNNYEQALPLSSSDIKEFCTEADADAAISLDMFVTSSDMELGKDAVGYFSTGYNELRGILGTSVRIYNKQGELISSPIVQIDSAFWSNQDQYIPHRSDALKELALISSEKVSRLLIPFWEKQDRWYFSDGTSGMKNAAKLIKENKWHEAALIWGELYENEQKTERKIKLASNIALANECLDDIENAAKWIEIAFSLLPDKSRSELAIMTAIYRGQLQQRQQNIPKLQKQLGDN